MKKYNIGSPKRKKTLARTPTRTHSKTLKKYNIGRPEKVVVTPDTPRSRKWKELTEKEGYKKYEILEYEPDESDLEAIEKRRKLGIPTPTKYTAFEEGTTEFMREAFKKKPLTDVVEQVNEEAWKKKPDDAPRRRSRGRSRRRSNMRMRMRKRN